MMQKSYSIAIVDEDSAVRKALSRLLTSAGFLARPYASGADFLNSLPHGVPDCVLVDLHTADLNELESKCRVNTAGPSVPTILMTAYDDPCASAGVIAAGALTCLSKPFTDDALFSAIDDAVHQNRA